MAYMNVDSLNERVQVGAHANRWGWAVAANALLVVASYVAIPIGPVPITLQSLAVTLVGAWLGPWAGGATVLAWLAEGATGLPVFAGGAAGVAQFFGPSGGYLLGFLPAAVISGWLFRSCAKLPLRLRAVATPAAAHLIVFGTGVAWLAQLVGGEAALASGLLPFLPGALGKCVVAAGALLSWRGPGRAADDCAT